MIATSKKRPCSGLLLICAALASGPAAATSDFLSDLVGRDSAGLGAVLRIEQSPYRGEGLRLDVLPLYLYEGEHVYLHSNRAGLKFNIDPRRRVDVFISRRLESFPVNQVPSSLSGMATRTTESEAGVSFEQRFDWGKVFVEYLRDTSHTSGGTEVKLGYSREANRGGLRLIPYFTLSVRDSRLNDYYYGVMVSEATADRPAYGAGGGVNGTLGVNARYDLSAHWYLLAGLSATYWASEVRNSPIVENRALQLAGYGGIAYEFEPSPPRRWEDGTPLFVKILYGRSSTCNLLPIMELRCGTLSTDEKTSIAAIDLGVPFFENPDSWSFVGYVGLLRHEERDLQPDFWQVNVYMKVFYWGFPWRNSVRTRVGFGAGLSYAQAVPFAEAQSQAERGRNTSKLLQYLDPTIDVSVGDLFGSKKLHETYFGFGVSHRSGMFGMAQLFDNVNGGSNYIYTYVEWRM
ncbi:MAG: MipA/OmpV family protein [Betaproteobacteria bacterium]|nr:MAG: MipA/OmpV family protein [Betaproteobacteria bacterium]